MGKKSLNLPCLFCKDPKSIRLLEQPLSSPLFAVQCYLCLFIGPRRHSENEAVVEYLTLYYKVNPSNKDNNPSPKEETLAIPKDSYPSAKWEL